MGPADTCPDYGSHVAQRFLDRLRDHPVSAQSGQFRIHSRPLGNVVYVMTSLWTPDDAVRAMEDAILDELNHS